MEQGCTQPGEAQARAKSIAEIYNKQGLGIFSKFHGDRSDVSFAERLLLHWSNLEERAPTIRIVCRTTSERPQPGLHQWDSPNLLWELMRTRRVKLTAQQLMSRNVSEAIVGKDNHAQDSAKYIVMSHPEPTRKTYDQRVSERFQATLEEGTRMGLNPGEAMTRAMHQYDRITHEEQEGESPSQHPLRGKCTPLAARNRAAQPWALESATRPGDVFELGRAGLQK